MGRDMMTAARLITCVGCDSQAVSRGSVAGHLDSTHDTLLRAKREKGRVHCDGLLRHLFAPHDTRGRSRVRCLCKRGGPGLR